MQRQGGPDVRVKYFDVPPFDPSADLRDREPMRAILEPAPSSNWVDVFVELLETADPMVRRSHPVLLDALITFFPAPEEARGTAILLKGLVQETNEAYRKRGFGDPGQVQKRKAIHSELQKLAASLNSEQPVEPNALGASPFARPKGGEKP
ncbi:hypothetical protein SAMN02800694_2758 [Luteibacter sp. UNCMF331Sha3.1]|uniref:hypothetical protein n=1 Tax=Luteibacter sp. UNCMF331Sha3.1 TaxID=1502760 RepID=UPI0008B7A3EE|nr:hypothetical protein [Luteibacter sp. UNCMF331Sha3.1]SEN09654.1 hypothetical protein SAMN02800694_2758 [Luteibacter sp. UNCMF331Sha3.1]